VDLDEGPDTISQRNVEALLIHTGEARVGLYDSVNATVQIAVENWFPNKQCHHILDQVQPSSLLVVNVLPVVELSSLKK